MPDDGLSDSTIQDDFFLSTRKVINNNDNINNVKSNENDVKGTTHQIHKMSTDDVEDDCESDDRTLVDDLVTIL